MELVCIVVQLVCLLDKDCSFQLVLNNNKSKEQRPS